MPTRRPDFSNPALTVILGSGTCITLHDNTFEDCHVIQELGMTAREDVLWCVSVLVVN